MYDRTPTGQADPGMVSPLSAPRSSSLPSSLPSHLQTSLPSSLPNSLPGGRRATPPYAAMRAADDGLFGLQGSLRTRLAMLGGILQLPTTLQGYLVFTFCLLILAFTMVLHITLSAEIMRLDERLLLLKSDFEATEHRNASLIYEISRYSSLQEAHRKAILEGYVPANEFKYVVERDEVIAALDNPAAADLTPQYLILGGDPNAAGAPTVVLPSAPVESAQESSFWSNFRWERVRGALAETGLWLRDQLPTWSRP